MSAPLLRVYLVRHGETNENRAGIIQGQMDTILNEDGHIQAALCGEALKHVKFAKALTSDLQRAVQTAEAILAHHPNVPFYSDSALRERNMGELQGVKAGSYDRKKIPKSCESGEQFTRRTIEWWKLSIEKLLPSIQAHMAPVPVNVLVVSHGAFIANLCRSLVAYQMINALPGVEFGHCLNTSVTIIDMRRDGRGALEKYASISHLVGPVVETNADEQPSGNDEK